MSKPKQEFHSQNQEFQQTLAEVLSRQYFMKHVGIQMVDCKDGKTKLKLEVEEKHLQQAHFLHGGVTATLADISMGFSALSLAPADKGMVTVDLHVSFYRPGDGSIIEVEAWVTKPGNLLYFCECSIYSFSNDQRIEIAKGHSTMCAVDKH